MSSQVDCRFYTGVRSVLDISCYYSWTNNCQDSIFSGYIELKESSNAHTASAFVSSRTFPQPKQDTWPTSQSMGSGTCMPHSLLGDTMKSPEKEEDAYSLLGGSKEFK
jgi:hypothetical protein